MGILDALLGSNPGILASLFGGGTPSVGIPPGGQPDIQGPSAPPGGVPSIPGNAVPWGQGGLLGNGILGNAARGALYGMGAAGQPGPKGFLAGVGRGAQQSIGMMDQRRASDERAAYLQMQQRKMAMEQQQQETQLKSLQELADNPPPGVDPERWRATVMTSPEAAAMASLKRLTPDVPSGYQAGEEGGLQPIPGGPEDPATIEMRAKIAARNAWHELAPGAVGGYGLGADAGGDTPTAPAAPANPVFAAAEEKYGLPPGSVAAIAGVESGGQGQRARSPAGAIGTMQLMPGTAKEMGVNPYDTEQNIDAGAGYFAGLLKKYKDVPTALAAYNAGPGRVDSWILAGRPQSGKGALPAETQAYVPKVMARMQSGQLQGQAPQGGIVAGPDGTVTNQNVAGGTWEEVTQGGELGQRNTLTHEFKPYVRSPVKPTVEGKIRDDYNAAVKDFSVAQAGYQKVVAAAKQPSAAGDVALIFGFMKILDPTSVVREGEFATAQNSGSVPTQVQALYNKIISGERLTPEQRADFVNTARSQFQVHKTVYTKLQQTYRGIAERSNVDPNNVVTDILLPDETPASAAPPPAAGEGEPDDIESLVKKYGAH